MNKENNRLLSIVLVIALLAIVLSACGDSNTPTEIDHVATQVEATMQAMAMMADTAIPTEAPSVNTEIDYVADFEANLDWCNENGVDVLQDMFARSTADLLADAGFIKEFNESIDAFEWQCTSFYDVRDITEKYIEANNLLGEADNYFLQAATHYRSGINNGDGYEIQLGNENYEAGLATISEAQRKLENIIN